jgi:hypothetical protein
MAQDLELDDDFLDEADVDESEMEEIPEIPEPKKPVAPASRKKAKRAKTAIAKEFDIRAAHQAWKEKNGIEDDYYY